MIETDKLEDGLVQEEVQIRFGKGFASSSLGIQKRAIGIKAQQILDGNPEGLPGLKIPEKELGEESTSISEQHDDIMKEVARCKPGKPSNGTFTKLVLLMGRIIRLEKQAKDHVTELIRKDVQDTLQEHWGAKIGSRVVEAESPPTPQSLITPVKQIAEVRDEEQPKEGNCQKSVTESWRNPVKSNPSQKKKAKLNIVSVIVIPPPPEREKLLKALDESNQAIKRQIQLPNLPKPTRKEITKPPLSPKRLQGLQEVLRIPEAKAKITQKETKRGFVTREKPFKSKEQPKPPTKMAETKEHSTHRTKFESEEPKGPPIVPKKTKEERENKFEAKKSSKKLEMPLQKPDKTSKRSHYEGQGRNDQREVKKVPIETTSSSSSKKPATFQTIQVTTRNPQTKPKISASAQGRSNPPSPTESRPALGQEWLQARPKQPWATKGSRKMFVDNPPGPIGRKEPQLATTNNSSHAKEELERMKTWERKMVELRERAYRQAQQNCDELKIMKEKMEKGMYPEEEMVEEIEMVEDSEVEIVEGLEEKSEEEESEDEWWEDFHIQKIDGQPYEIYDKCHKCKMPGHPYKECEYKRVRRGKRKRLPKRKRDENE